MLAELPDLVKPYAGRINDVDTHEQIPAHMWVETFGEAMRPFAEVKLSQPANNPNHPNTVGYAGDVKAITPEGVWLDKGCVAPGAVDVRRRLEVMDVMQVRRQLMFPTAAGIYGMMTYTAPEGSAQYRLFGDRSEAIGRRMLEAGNEWLIAAGKVSERIRPVANLYGETVEDLTSLARGLIKQGARALTISASRPPGGLSPAAKALDPLYAMLAEAKVTLTVHVGGEAMFLRSNVWNEAEAFEGFKVTEELSGDPMRLSTFHFAAQNFVAALVLGGVFERHPDLRFGVVEYGANFIGPLAATLDMWSAAVSKPSQTAGTLMRGQQASSLPAKPSDYIRRNVRVTPFDFEPVGEYIAKYGLEEVYCFATDYPHIEGGKDPMGNLSRSLSEHGHGPSVFEKFFVTNGAWLLPD